MPCISSTLPQFPLSLPPGRPDRAGCTSRETKARRASAHSHLAAHGRQPGLPCTFSRPHCSGGPSESLSSNPATEDSQAPPSRNRVAMLGRGCAWGQVLPPPAQQRHSRQEGPSAAGSATRGPQWSGQGAGLTLEPKGREASGAPCRQVEPWSQDSSKDGGPFLPQTAG